MLWVNLSTRSKSSGGVDRGGGWGQRGQERDGYKGLTGAWRERKCVAAVHAAWARFLFPGIPLCSAGASTAPPADRTSQAHRGCCTHRENTRVSGHPARCRRLSRTVGGCGCVDAVSHFSFSVSSLRLRLCRGEWLPQAARGGRRGRARKPQRRAAVRAAIAPGSVFVHCGVSCAVPLCGAVGAEHRARQCHRARGRVAGAECGWMAAVCRGACDRRPARPQRPPRRCVPWKRRLAGQNRGWWQRLAAGWRRVSSMRCRGQPQSTEGIPTCTQRCTCHVQGYTPVPPYTYGCMAHRGTHHGCDQLQQIFLLHMCTQRRVTCEVAKRRRLAHVPHDDIGAWRRFSAQL